MLKSLVLAGVAAGVLCGCSLSKTKMGLAKESPDEFMVMSRAPLSLPPEYGVKAVNSQIKAQEAENKQWVKNLSEGERRFLKNAETAVKAR